MKLMPELRATDAAAFEFERQMARTARQSFVALALIFEKYAVFTAAFAVFAFLFLAVGLTPVFSAQLNVPLTVQETIYPGAPTEGITRVQDPVTVGIPIAGLPCFPAQFDRPGSTELLQLDERLLLSDSKRERGGQLRGAVWRARSSARLCS